MLSEWSEDPRTANAEGAGCKGTGDHIVRVGRAGLWQGEIQYNAVQYSRRNAMNNEVCRMRALVAKILGIIMSAARGLACSMVSEIQYNTRQYNTRQCIEI